MADETPQAVVTATVRAKPAIVTSLKLWVANAVSAIAGLLLLVLPYLMTVDLTEYLTKQQLLMWTVGLNVLTLILRTYFTKPVVVQGAPSSGGQP